MNTYAHAAIDRQTDRQTDFQTNTQVKNIGALIQNSPSGESFHLQLSGCPSMPAEKGPSSYNSSLYVPVNN